MLKTEMITRWWATDVGRAQGWRLNVQDSLIEGPSLCVVILIVRGDARRRNQLRWGWGFGY